MFSLSFILLLVQKVILLRQLAFLLHLLLQVTDATEFGNSWLYNQADCSVSAVTPPNPCLNVDALTLSKLRTLCSSVQVGKIPSCTQLF